MSFPTWLKQKITQKRKPFFVRRFFQKSVAKKDPFSSDLLTSGENEISGPENMFIHDLDMEIGVSIAKTKNIEDLEMIWDNYGANSTLGLLAIKRAKELGIYSPSLRETRYHNPVEEEFFI